MPSEPPRLRRRRPRATLLAIDPGTTESAWVLYRAGEVLEFGKDANVDVCTLVERAAPGIDLVIEMIASYGMPVGAEVFETCVWIGRFEQAWDHRSHTLRMPRRVFRKDVKLHLCQSPRANDASIRQAIIDRFGPGKDAAIGRKAAPGPLYGVAGDVWAAIAVAITADETPRVA